MQQDAPTPARGQLLKMGIDLAPLLVFFAAYMTFGIYWATGALMVTTVASMIASWVLLSHISATLIVTTALVVGFGALTLFFNDARFIKIKPTIVNLVFALILLGGLYFKKSLLRYVLDAAVQLTEEGWRILTLRWGVFFVFLAGLNEVIWRNFPTDFWVNFKVFGMLSITLIFTLCQIPLIQKTMVEEEK